jgi:hypothetical protein
LSNPEVREIDQYIFSQRNVLESRPECNDCLKFLWRGVLKADGDEPFLQNPRGGAPGYAQSGFGIQ